MTTTKFDYKRYLASREWAELKAAVRMRAASRDEFGSSMCERCRVAPLDDVHHLTYERIGRERLGDLIGVCRGCHEFLGGRTDVDPSTSPAAIEAARQRLGRQLDRMPSDGLYWHARDGRPCPCAECCSGDRTAPRAVVLRWAASLVGTA